MAISVPECEIFISDIHRPYHDKRAWSLFVKVLQQVNPSLLWIGGDYADFYAVSRFDKKPKRKMELQSEIDDAVKGLKELRNAVPNAIIVWQQGNHEERLVKYLWGKAPELSRLNCLSFSELFSLKSLDIQYIGDYKPQSVGKLWHIHGDKLPGGTVNPAKVKMAQANDHLICGHHHTAQIYYGRDIGNKTRYSIVNGCLCGLSPEYNPINNWMHSATVIYYAKSGLFQPTQVIFTQAAKSNKLQCIFEGKLLES